MYVYRLNDWMLAGFYLFTIAALLTAIKTTETALVSDYDKKKAKNTVVDYEWYLLMLPPPHSLTILI